MAIRSVSNSAASFYQIDAIAIDEWTCRTPGPSDSDTISVADKSANMVLWETMLKGSFSLTGPRAPGAR